MDYPSPILWIDMIKDSYVEKMWEMIEKMWKMWNTFCILEIQQKNVFPICQNTIWVYKWTTFLFSYKKKNEKRSIVTFESERKRIDFCRPVFPCYLYYSQKTEDHWTHTQAYIPKYGIDFFLHFTLDCSTSHYTVKNDLNLNLMVFTFLLLFFSVFCSRVSCLCTNKYQMGQIFSYTHIYSQVKWYPIMDYSYRP